MTAIYALRICFGLAILAAFGLAAVPARAQIFQVTAKGMLDQVDNPDHLFDASVTPGVPFTYIYTFDLGATDSNVNASTSGQYILSGSFYGATVTVGDYTIHPSTLSSATLRVEMNPPEGGNYVETQETSQETLTSTNPNAPTVAQAMTNLFLFYRAPSPIKSKAMPPPSVYNVSLLAQTAFAGPFVLRLIGPGDPNKYQDQALGRLTSLTITPEAPTPKSASLTDPQTDTAAIRHQFEAKDAVIADLRRQVTALQTELRRMKTAPRQSRKRAK